MRQPAHHRRKVDARGGRHGQTKAADQAGDPREHPGALLQAQLRRGVWPRAPRFARHSDVRVPRRDAPQHVGHGRRRRPRLAGLRLLPGRGPHGLVGPRPRVRPRRLHQVVPRQRLRRPRVALRAPRPLLRVAVQPREAPRQDEPPHGRRDAQPQHEVGDAGGGLRDAVRSHWRGGLRGLPALHAPRRRLARVPRDQRDGRAAPLQHGAARRPHVRPLPPELEALPAELAPAHPDRHDRVARVRGGHRRRDVQIRLRPRRVLLLGPVHVGQLLARALHVAPAHVARRAALWRRRVDVGPRRALHHRPPLRGALRLLRLDAPPHRLDARLPPPLLEPPVLPCGRGDEAPQGVPEAQAAVQLRPRPGRDRDVEGGADVPVRRRHRGHPVPQGRQADREENGLGAGRRRGYRACE
mmetsp:Transcript_3702/g.11497  ORF Transcript_3702/g.11497 Transcript_3702/m.11497 type:complete len:412 (+) Transcript_3702:145-1380(+)